METGEKLCLPMETPEESVFPYASPLDTMRSADKVVEVKEEKKEEVAEEKSSKGRRALKKVIWPPLVQAMEGVEIVLLTGDIREVLKKSKFRGHFHRAFMGSMAVLPFFEEMGLTKGGKDPFQAADGSAAARIRRPPRVDFPDAFGLRKDESALAGALAPGAEVVFETMKYQAHFEGSTRVAFRHRVAQAGHLCGWRALDERRAVPRMESDMPDRKYRDIEKDATDFVRFVTVLSPSTPNAE